MSLKSKLEAVIYAAEEPVTLAQLSSLFGAEALEWKAEQEAAAAEQSAEVAGEIPPPLPLGEATPPEESLVSTDVALPPAENTSSDEAPAPPPVEEIALSVEELSEPEPEAAPGEHLPASPDPAPAADAEAPADQAIDPDAEAKRLARQRDRDVRAVLKQLLDELIATYESDERGLEIREIAGGYRMATKPECHDAVRMFVKSLKPAMKLSLPALETLAVVAYKQPVTAPEVSEIRGVESGGVLGSLLARKLVATAGRKQVIGRPILYKTTKEFLLRFGLKDLNELPSMDEFEKMAAIEIEEMEPEAAAAEAAQGAALVAAAEQAEPDSTEQPKPDSVEQPEDAASQTAPSTESTDPTLLEENSPSGQELAEFTAEVADAPEPASAQSPEQATLEESPAVTAAEPSLTSNEQSSAPAETEETGSASQQAPEENEAVPHAEEEQEEHRR